MSWCLNYLIKNKQINHDKHPDESKTRTHRLSKLPDDGDPWTPNNRSKRKTPVGPRWAKQQTSYNLDEYELISKYNVGLKTLLSEGLLEPEFYGDLVYKFKKLKGINDFSFQFRKIITRYRRIGYNLNVMRQSACLVFNPIMIDNYAAFFNCTPVGRASDSMMAPT